MKEDTFIGLSNAFELINSRFLVVPFGDHEHPMGIQRLTLASARRMESNFSSLRGRMARRFGGLPFFIGHPDDPAFSNEHRDTRSYGWIMDVAAREAGLYLDVKWSDAGHELLNNAHYKYFSPRWGARIAGTEGGRKVLEPTVLLSCGLTNNPQIPVLPLANEQPENTAKQQEERVMQEWLKKLFELKDDAGEEDVKTAVSNAKKAADAKAEAETTLANEKAARTGADAAKAQAEQALANEKKAKETAEAALASERKERIGLVVANAIAAGKIMPADKDRWTADLGKDFEAKMTELSNAKPVVKVQSRTDGLAMQSNAAQSVQSRIITLVNERMEKSGLSYDICFQQVKKEQPDLFKTKTENQG